MHLSYNTATSIEVNAPPVRRRSRLAQIRKALFQRVEVAPLVGLGHREQRDAPGRLASLAPQAQHVGVVGWLGHGLLPGGCLVGLGRVYDASIDTSLTHH